ncbi:hypothetical protein ACI48D_24855 [Massilia sp. LXY-6]|uniref:hypothetical protein n=1 Tax=Massilia sp. LXY-6 TaxID=3379823 RepID=UPI003EE222CC
MSNVFPDRLRFADMLYAIDSAPLEPYLASLPTPPPRQVTPFSQRGYVATWTIHLSILYLADITSHAYAKLFAHAGGPMAASWFSGFIHGWRGDARRTGETARKFWDDEIVIEVAAGRVTREWVLDLRAVPDQTSEELYRSLPAFFFKL